MRTPLEQLAMLLDGDAEHQAQGRELVRALAGPAPIAQARLCVDAGSLSEATAILLSARIALDPGRTRLIACDLAELAVQYVESDVIPRPGKPSRDPRCDQVIAGMRAIARGTRPLAHRDRLLPIILEADRDGGWWETEAVYAVVDDDPLAALDGAARSLEILVRNIDRPSSAAAPPQIRAALQALLQDPALLQE